MHNTEQLVVVCDTDSRQRGLGTDHIPVLMTLDLEIPSAVEASCRNYRAVDWPKFRNALMEQLASMPDPCTLLDEMQFQEAVNGLMTAIQVAIELTVPMSKPSLHSWHWWNDELLRLKKEMNHLASASYKYHAVADHPLHNQYTDTRNRYRLAIKWAKNSIGTPS